MFTALTLRRENKTQAGISRRTYGQYIPSKVLREAALG
jgi:hypothetical protein